MCSRPSASTATTPRCRCWRARKPSPGASGPTCATTARSAVPPHRPQCSIIRVIAAARIRAATSPRMQASCRRTPMPGSTNSTTRARKPGPLIEAACWAHGRRKLFVLADVAKAPLAIEAVRRIDAIFAAERNINGLGAAQRHAIRQVRVAPLVRALEAWMRTERSKLSRHAEVAKAMDYMLKRWAAFTRFLEDGRICLTNNAAEREMRAIALGRKSWLFAGSDRGGERAAAMYTLIATAKLNGVDPRAWLADVLARIADHPASRLDELLPWHWPRRSEDSSLAA